MAMSAEKKTGGGFNPEDEMSRTANTVDKETKPVPGCAGNIGTGNVFGCPLAKLPLVMFKLMFCKGTAEGDGNTCALACILLTGKNRWNRSLQWQKTFTAKLRHSPMSMTMDSRFTQ